MDKPTTDKEFVNSAASTGYSQGFYDGFAEGSNKALVAVMEGDKLGVAFVQALFYVETLLSDEQKEQLADYLEEKALPALDEWSKLRDQIIEG